MLISLALLTRPAPAFRLFLNSVLILQCCFLRNFCTLLIVMAENAIDIPAFLLTRRKKLTSAEERKLIVSRYNYTGHSIRSQFRIFLLGRRSSKLISIVRIDQTGIFEMSYAFLDWGEGESTEVN